MSKRLNLVGQKFGRLFIIKDAGNNKHQQSLWLCKCICGNEKIVSRCALKGGYIKSCGCLHREKSAQNGKNNKGRQHSKQTKKKMSESTTGFRHSKKTKEKISKGKMGESNPNYRHGLSRTKEYDSNMKMKRRVKKKNQTPIDADQTKIQKLYSCCAQLNNFSFLKYEVDHIIPINKGGSHHQDNLQVLRADLNNKKKDKITDEYKGITLKDLEMDSFNISTAIH